MSEAASPASIDVLAKFTLAERVVVKKLHMTIGRRISVGRTKENDLTIEDASVSKIHASLVLNSERKFVVSDTGSTNGTFINEVRIAYGKAIELAPADHLIFGAIEVAFELIAPTEVSGGDAQELSSDSYTVGDFEFTRRVANEEQDSLPLLKTTSSAVPQPDITRPTTPLLEPEREETK